MKRNSKFRADIIVLAIIIAGAATRFIPHPPNFTAIGAIALFGGAYFTRKWLAVILPLIILFISDFIIEIISPGMGFHRTMPFVYGSFILISLLGFYLRADKQFIKVTAYSLLSSVIFFIISNIGSWLVFYPRTVTGFTACYIAAIPFFHYNILGDFFYNAVFFFGTYYIFSKHLVSSPVNE